MCFIIFLCIISITLPVFYNISMHGVSVISTYYSACFAWFPNMSSLWYFHLNSCDLYYFYTWYLFSIIPFHFCVLHTTSVHIYPLHFICLYYICAYFQFWISFVLSALCMKSLIMPLNSVYVLHYSYAWSPIFFYLSLCFTLCLCTISLLFSLLQSRWDLYCFYAFITFSSKFCGGSILFRCTPLIFSINGGLYYLSWCVLFSPLNSLCFTLFLSVIFLLLPPPLNSEFILFPCMSSFPFWIWCFTLFLCMISLSFSFLNSTSIYLLFVRAISLIFILNSIFLCYFCTSLSFSPFIFSFSISVHGISRIFLS